MTTQTTNTMTRLLEVLSLPEIHSKATATRWALHVVVAAATHVGNDALGLESYDRIILAGQELAKEYSQLLAQEAVR